MSKPDSVPMARLDDLMLTAGVVNTPAWFGDIKLPNWPFPHQMETLKQYPNHLRYADFSDPGCVSADTEFLTPEGWKRIDAYQEGDQVAQFDPNTLSAEFVRPLRYIKAPCDEMYVVRPSRGLSMKLSADHRVLSFTQGAGHYRVDSMRQVAETHDHHVNGFRGLFRSTFSMAAPGMPLSDEQIRVMVMVMADGSFTAAVGTRCSVRVLKDRKKVRCRELLTSAGIAYTEYAAPADYAVFTFYAPRREKHYQGDWWQASPRQRHVIFDEVRYWDGSVRGTGGFSFTSLDNDDCDFVQFVAITCGLNATVAWRNRLCQGRPMTEGTVTVYSKGLMHRLSSAAKKTEIYQEATEDGFQYCFTVPSSFLVLRREGRVFTTGNCGKTFPAQAHAILMAALKNKVVFTMPPKLIRQFQGELRDFFVGIGKHLHIDHLDVGAVQKDKRMKRWDKEGWPDILLLSYDAFRAFNARSAMRTVGRTQWKMPDGETSYWVKDEEGNPVARDRFAQPHTKDGDPITFNKKGVPKAENRNRLRLKTVGYNVFFFDEAHALCNPESIVFRAVQHMDHTLGDDIAIYLMTGTPIPTHLEDVYGLIRILDRDAYANKAQFDRKHVSLNPNTRYRQVVGYDNEDEIYEHLYRYARRVQKRDLPHLGLKDPLITATPIQLAGKHKKLYDQVLRDRFAVLGDKVLTPDNDSALRMLALQLISCPDEFDESGVIGQDNELAKWLDDKLESINPANHKVIIFAYFKRTVSFLSKRYAKWNPAVMNGTTTKGWKEVDRFNDDDSCRVFIVNWDSGGAGLNLQIAHHIAFYEVPTSPKGAKQAIARADRTGQENIVNVYFPRVIGTLLDRNFKNLLKNEEQNNKVVRDAHDLLYEQLRVTRRAA